MAATKATSQRENDTRLLDFVREKVDTFVKWDLVRFFHDNPFAADSAENIARFAGRDARTVERDLQDLVRSGVVETNVAGNGTTRIYRYVKDQQIRDDVQRFVIACDDREFRVRAINQVIEGLQ
jgi:predicted transcriptional regulator